MPYYPDVSLTFRGRLVNDPTLRFINGRDREGIAVCNARVAHTDRKRQADGKWVDGDTLFLDITAWNKTAEQLAMLVAGTPLILDGKAELKEWQGRDGDGRTTLHLTVERVAVDVSMVRDIESGKGWVTLKWGRAAGPPPVASGLEDVVAQQQAPF